MKWLLLLLLASSANAAEGASVEATGEAPPRTYGNLRIGGGTSSRHPEVCLELSPLERLGIEACGTGSGFLHKDPDPEVAHFRGTFRVAELQLGDGWLLGNATFGFAELQEGEDDAGFSFTGTDPRRHSTSGAELGAGARYVMPMTGGFDFLAVLQGSMAYLPYAPDLVKPVSKLQPGASLTLGVGF